MTDKYKELREALEKVEDALWRHRMQNIIGNPKLPKVMSDDFVSCLQFIILTHSYLSSILSDLDNQKEKLSQLLEQFISQGKNNEQLKSDLDKANAEIERLKPFEEDVKWAKKLADDFVKAGEAEYGDACCTCGPLKENGK